MVKKVKKRQIHRRQPKSKSLKKHQVKAILFDLGNTLYDKNQFMESAFKEVAAFLQKKYKFGRSILEELILRIWKIHRSHYEFLFKDLLEIIGIYSVTQLDQVLDVYHNHKPKLKPYPGVPGLLKSLKKHYRIGLMTDGHPRMQRNKVKAFGWKETFDVIVYSAEHLQEYLKPSPLVYQLAAKKLKVRPSETVYVGDNPYDDFKGARQLGIFTVRVLQGEFKDIRLKNKGREADRTIKRITDLKKLLLPR
jgi:putative hydrolase of the HAD superfamily